MPEVPITQTFSASDRNQWRKWLSDNHAIAKEIWLILPKAQPSITYLEAVEEALCFGWIDGILKKLDPERSALRFTPRRPKSHWTELNKERARRLIESGRMTDAGRAVLPDLSPESFQYPADILAAIQADPQAWENYQLFPELYRRIRVSAIDEVRDQPEMFRKRLENFLKKTRENKMYGVME